jgi:hypothetical protein
MTIRQVGYVQFRSHRVVVSKDDESNRIYCFKHTPSRCEFESFDQEDDAADYIITPMPSIGYQVVIDGEESESDSEKV